MGKTVYKNDILKDINDEISKLKTEINSQQVLLQNYESKYNDLHSNLFGGLRDNNLEHLTYLQQIINVEGDNFRYIENSNKFRDILMYKLGNYITNAKMDLDIYRKNLSSLELELNNDRFIEYKTTLLQMTNDISKIKSNIEEVKDYISTNIGDFDTIIMTHPTIKIDHLINKILNRCSENESIIDEVLTLRVFITTKQKYNITNLNSKWLLFKTWLPFYMSTSERNVVNYFINNLHSIDSSLIMSINNKNLEVISNFIENMLVPNNLDKIVLLKKLENKLEETINKNREYIRDNSVTKNYIDKVTTQYTSFKDKVLKAENSLKTENLIIKVEDTFISIIEEMITKNKDIVDVGIKITDCKQNIFVMEKRINTLEDSYRKVNRQSSSFRVNDRVYDNYYNSRNDTYYYNNIDDGIADVVSALVSVVDSISSSSSSYSSSYSSLCGSSSSSCGSSSSSSSSSSSCGASCGS